MTNLQDLRTAYDTAKSAHLTAQALERDTRRDAYNAGVALTTAACEAVRPHFTENTVFTRRSGKEIMIVGFRSNVWNPDLILAVYVERIKSGAWGKTRNTSSVVWNFETNSWVEQ